jgi:ADP-ribosylation factor-binding protein GGA
VSEILCNILFEWLQVLETNDELTRVLDLYENVKAGNQGASPTGGMLMGDGSADAVPIQTGGGAGAGGSAGGNQGLMDLFDSGPSPPVAAVTNGLAGMGVGGPAPSSNAGLMDLFDSGPSPPAATQMSSPDVGLMDLFGSGPSPPASSQMGGGLMDLGFGGPPQVAAVPDIETLVVPIQTVQPGPAPPANVYNKNGLVINLVFAKNPPHPSIALVVISATNSGAAPVTNLSFQVAVPKALKVKLQPASATTVPVNNPMMGSQPVNQVMLIANPTKVPIRIRFKLDFVINGQSFTDTGDCANFPAM